jgi:aminocarboxymuconate-semialdehyde decarboxylase
MKIDVYSHILTPKYLALYAKKNPKVMDSVEVKILPCIDINVRMRLMERYPGVLQVLTIANPPLDALVSPKDAAELATIANDELAELVAMYPNKFIAAVACVPMNNIDAALKEAERAIIKLGMRGIQTATRVHGESLDLPKFRPLYELMAKLDLPIWIHPYDNDKLDRDSGDLNWPFETATAMFRLVNARIFDDYPNIKFITHHCGSMIPTFAKRIPRPEVFRKFYNDTALYGNTAGIMCAHAFFGCDHILFGTDAPFEPDLVYTLLGPQFGLTQTTIDSVERMTIPDAEKEKIFLQNALKLLRLSI